MRKRMIIILYFAIIVHMLAGCCLKHEFSNATCSESKVCSKCGIKQGDPLGHKYGEATCTTPKICTVCGETEGEKLGHKADKWEITEEATLNKNGTRVKKCSVCGECVEKENLIKIPQVTSNGFNFEIKEFINYVEEKTDGRVYIAEETMSNIGAGKAYGVKENGEFLGTLITFVENSDGTVKGMMGVSEKEFGSLPVMLVIAKVIDGNFETEIGLKQIYYTNSYKSCGMSMTSGNLDEYSCVTLMPKIE